jgi:hypothetical protein
MSGGAPIPVINNKNESPKEAKIFCIADLEEEGSKKLPKVVRGKLYFNDNHLSYIFSLKLSAIYF